MSLRWYMIRSRIALFFERHKIFLRRFYWFSVIMIVVLALAIPITLRIINPHVRLHDIHGTPPEVRARIQEWNSMVAQARREQGRLHDFNELVNILSENYPYLELIVMQKGVDYRELAAAVLDELT